MSWQQLTHSCDRCLCACSHYFSISFSSELHTVVFTESSSPTSSTLCVKAAWSWLPRCSPPASGLYFSLSHTIPVQCWNLQLLIPPLSPPSHQLMGCCLMLSPGLPYLFFHWSRRVMFSWGRCLVFLFPPSCWRGGDRGGRYKSGRRCCSRTKQALEIQRDSWSQQSDVQESIQHRWVNSHQHPSHTLNLVTFLMITLRHRVSDGVRQRCFIIFPGKQFSDMVPFISGDTMEADKKTAAQTVSDRYGWAALIYLEITFHILSLPLDGVPNCCRGVKGAVVCVAYMRHTSVLSCPVSIMRLIKDMKSNCFMLLQKCSYFNRWCPSVAAGICQSRSKTPRRTFTCGQRAPNSCWASRGARSHCNNTRSV